MGEETLAVSLHAYPVRFSHSFRALREIDASAAVDFVVTHATTATTIDMTEEKGFTGL